MKKTTDIKRCSTISRFYDSRHQPTSYFLEAVEGFMVVCGDKKLAKAICSQCTIKKLDSGELISKQDGDDDCVYFILSGRVNVLVNGCPVAERESGELIGEMSMMSLGKRRCASLVACSSVELLILKRKNFLRLTKDYPMMVRRMFNVLADRLRERNDVIRLPNNPPNVFIGSSAKGSRFAHRFCDRLKKEIEQNLHADDGSGRISNVNLRYWDRSVFSPSGTTLGTLIDESEQADFAIFALTKDDLLEVRKANGKWLPRDNVIFEIGLFMGAISKDRTILVMDEKNFLQLKLPTDLQGFTLAVFDSSSRKSFHEKAAEVANLITRKGSISGVRR